MLYIRVGVLYELILAAFKLRQVLKLTLLRLPEKHANLVCTRRHLTVGGEFD